MKQLFIIVALMSAEFLFANPGGDPRYQKKSWSEVCSEIMVGTNPGNIPWDSYVRYSDTLKAIIKAAFDLKPKDPDTGLPRAPTCQDLEDYFRGRLLNLSKSSKPLELSLLVKLHDVAALNLSGNSLRDIKGLKLFIPNGQIEHGGLDDSLVEINLSDNDLTSIAELGDYHGLRRIKVSKNRLTTLDDVANPTDPDDPYLPPNWPKAELLDVSNNPQFAFPPPVSGSTSSRTFAIARMGWGILDLSFTSVSHLQFLRGTIRSTITSLDINALKLDGIDPASTIPMPHLFKLSARGTTGMPMGIFSKPFEPSEGEPTSQVPDLVFVDLSDTNTEDLSPLKLVPRLSVLLVAGDKDLELATDKLFCAEHNPQGQCIKQFGHCLGEIKVLPEDMSLPIREICCYAEQIEMPFGVVSDDSGKVCAKFSIGDAVFR